MKQVGIGIGSVTHSPCGRGFIDCWWCARRQPSRAAVDRWRGRATAPAVQPVGVAVRPVQHQPRLAHPADTGNGGDDHRARRARTRPHRGIQSAQLVLAAHERPGRGGAGRATDAVPEPPRAPTCPPPQPATHRVRPAEDPVPPPADALTRAADYGAYRSPRRGSCSPKHPKAPPEPPASAPHVTATAVPLPRDDPHRNFLPGPPTTRRA